MRMKIIGFVLIISLCFFFDIRADGSRRITDLIFFLGKDDLSEMINNLRTWTSYPPCTALSDAYDGMGNNAYLINSSHPDGKLGHNVRLTFALAHSEQCFECKKQLIEVFNALPSNVKSCFTESQIKYQSVLLNNVKENNERTRDKMLFKSMISGSFGLNNPGYVLRLDSYVRPLRSNWLSRLDLITRDPIAPFWVKGSVPRHIIGSKDIHQRFHLNRNAIYNLADSRFKKFLMEKVFLTFGEADYDLNMMKFVLDGKNYGYTQHFMHLFQRTEAIQNYGNDMTKSRDHVRERFPKAVLLI